MVKIKTSHFSIRQISESGQCFRLNQVSEDKYAVTAFGTYLELEQSEDEVTFHCTEEEYAKIWRGYFDLDRDYGKYFNLGEDADQYISGAMDFGSGIRILNQELWEMLISFTISQQNNIVRIKKCIELLCRRFGEEKFRPDGTSFFTFPDVCALSRATEEDLRLCNLGYRSRYITRIAKSIMDKEADLEVLKEMNYINAKKELLKFYGVGEKVADCICLFALHHLDAFPVDTHINKVLERNYPGGFPFERYTGYAGVIQQYIFYYDLKGGKRHFI